MGTLVDASAGLRAPCHRTVEREGVSGDRRPRRGRFANEPVLTITTTGRRTGKRRTTTLLDGEYGEDLVVIASNRGSDRPPAWALNLLADPEADVQVGKRRVHVHARSAEGDERAALSAMSDAYHGFDGYAAHTARRIPVFVLAPTPDCVESPRSV